MKPQRPLKPEIKQLLQMLAYIYNIHSQHKIEHSQDIHITQKYMQEKLLLFILKWKMPLYKGVPEHGL
jgi:hypothetical protein